MKNIFQPQIVVVDTPQKARIMTILYSIKIIILLAMLAGLIALGDWTPTKIAFAGGFAVLATIYQFVFLPRWYKTHDTSPLTKLLRQL